MVWLVIVIGWLWSFGYSYTFLLYLWACFLCLFSVIEMVFIDIMVLWLVLNIGIIYVFERRGLRRVRTFNEKIFNSGVFYFECIGCEFLVVR